MKTYKTRKNLPVMIFGFAMVAFVLSQLIINAVLNPLGTELQSLNKENSYIPEINFDGKYECYKQINIETWNFIKNNIILTTASMLK